MEQWDFVARAKDGCPKAQAELVERFQRPLFSFLYRFVGDSAAAEELCQDVFLRAFRSLNGLRSADRLSTWLFTIAANAARNWRRNEGRSRHVQLSAVRVQEERDERADSRTNGTREQAHNAEMVRQAVAMLPVRERTALVLRVYHEHSYEQIGAVMGCSTSVVRNLLYRARRRLAARLRKLVE